MSEGNSQSKAVADAMIGLWQGEFPATVRVMSAMSDDTRDYRPAAKSRSGWELVTHLATADLWFIDCIVRGVFELDREASKQAAARFGGVKDVVAFYESAFPAALDRLRGLTAEELGQSMDFFGMMQMPRAQWIGFANNHSVHHRGQLSAYLRAMNCRVPDIYGPSGDAEPVPAAT